jgi:hypothetical protein
LLQRYWKVHQKNVIALPPPGVVLVLRLLEKEDDIARLQSRLCDASFPTKHYLVPIWCAFVQRDLKALDILDEALAFASLALITRLASGALATAGGARLLHLCDHARTNLAHHILDPSAITALA